jgi:hypothetical protein
MVYTTRQSRQCIIRMVIITGMPITGTIITHIIVIIAIIDIIIPTGDLFITGMHTVRSESLKRKAKSAKQSLVNAN